MSHQQTSPPSILEVDPVRTQYPFPWGVATSLVWSAFCGKKRSFARDARACISLLKPHLKVRYSENIPTHGPCLVCTNHYSRPGFHAWWIALAASACLPFDVHWVMTDAWRFEGKPFSQLLEALSRWGFQRAARVYGFTSMPPMPPREHEIAARASSVRQLLNYARHDPCPVIGLVPEGHDMPGGQLGVAPSGVGRLVAHLLPYTQHILPVATFEDQGNLCLSFGQTFTLEPPTNAKPDFIDRYTSDALMGAIAILLPSHLRGAYI